MEQEDKRFQVGIYETYLLLRDGIEPVKDFETRQKTVEEFLASGQIALQANQTLSSSSQTPDCKRFLNLYKTVIEQLEANLTKYLRQPDLSKDSRVNLVARLETLKMFETSLFSLVMFNAEAGYSDLDPSARRTCKVRDRSSWQNKMLHVHQDAMSSHLAFFGQKSVNNPITRQSALNDFGHRYSTRQTEKKIGFVSAELLASILVWEKAIQPWLGPMGRTAKVMVNSAYIIGLVSLDKLARKNISFLKDSPNISNGQALASWTSLMSFAEEFTAAEDTSPELYTAYLKLIETTERQRSLDFLTENEWLLADAEAKYGSVDAALNILKEESAL